MAGGGPGASSFYSSSSSSSLPPLSAEEATALSAPPPSAAPAPPAGGEFLLHLLQRPPQSRAIPPPPPSSAASGSGGGGGHEDPAVVAVGPSIPFLSLSTAAAPVNPHPQGPPPWAGVGCPGFHQAPWAAAPSELRSARPPPPGFHQHHHQYSHHYNKHNASQSAGAVSAAGFLGGPFDARDLRRKPGLSQQHQEQQPPPERDGFPTEGTPLLFGSFASAGGGRVCHGDPYPPDKIDASCRGGVQVHPDVSSARHPVAHNVSTGRESRDHEKERVLDGGSYFVVPSHPGSSWIPQPKAHHRWQSHPWRENGDRLGQKPRVSPQQRSGKEEPGKLPPCPPEKAKDVRKRVSSSNGRNGEHTHDELAVLPSGEPKRLPSNNESVLSRQLQRATQLDHSGPSLQTETRSVLASDAKEHRGGLHFHSVSMLQRVEQISERELDGLVCISDPNEEQDQSSQQCVDSMELTDHIIEKRVEVHLHASRGKDYRSDFSRGHHVLSQRMRNRRRELRCRHNIAVFIPSFLALYESLIPSEEEKAKQRQLLQSLEKLVLKEWPNARLYLYGSCANSFGVLNSDIDVCLAIEDNDINKSEIILKLADILLSDNLQNVQALTRARVPIVKLMDPVTGISCDICINNILAVVNTKLLRDYAQIDDRLRQLAFIVKHWAKSRGVNDTYQGTLSSYAYVLMCIHFLQLRNPAILPCLQEMESTYAVTVDDIECAFFDQVERLRDFGSENRENIAELLWAFFSYWAYHHDYANDVISVRTGGIMSKQSKNWTRRFGNDRHLICIEDPFELSHDLGRVVDKYTIKILREEFERAAEIMQYDPNPSDKLFEPYVRVSEQG